MEGNATRLTYAFLLCVWIVICRLLWDTGALTTNNNNTISNLNNLEDWLSLAPSIMSSASSLATALVSELEETTIVEGTGGAKKEAVKEISRSDMESKQLTPEQEEQLKDLIDFTLGDEIEREDINAEQIQ
ncbi:MAG: hypothetical protein SGBAC_012509, partial [Bacillariaceae sp.]